MKENVAFVVTGYGKDINGGTEQHCRMLAERLVSKYNVEVLTTCIKNYKSGQNEYLAGEEWLNGVLVRRFEGDPIDQELHDFYTKKSKKLTRLRKLLYSLRILSLLSFVHWDTAKKIEEKVMKSYVFYSPKLIEYLQSNKNKYKAIITINISYPLAYYTSVCVPEKTILIPTMHLESSSFRGILAEVFAKVAYIGYNTEAEQKLGERIFGPSMAKHGIISVGIDEAEDADWDATKLKYGLPNEYALFVGRIDPGKLNHIVDYFFAYKQKYTESTLKLVLVGGLFTPNVNHSDILYTGFVSEGEKYAIIQHAKIFINPSKLESLSLILLEGMSRGKALLVNGKCAVLKEHCKKSGGAAVHYVGKNQFISKLYFLDHSQDLRDRMGEKGKMYVSKNYNWKLIMDRLTNVIESI